MLPRMVHRYSRVQDGFGAIRKENPSQEISDLQCFLTAIASRVSTQANKILNQSHDRLRSALALSEVTIEKIPLDGKKPIEQDVDVFKAVLDYDVKRKDHDSTWRLNEPELQAIIKDYLLLRDFHIGDHLKLLDPILDLFGTDFLTKAESENYERLLTASEEQAKAYLHDTSKPKVLQFWNYAVLICRRLQEGENRLSAQDAYWLGILDEVIGTNMHGDRAIVEAEISSDAQNQTPNLAPSNE